MLKEMSKTYNPSEFEGDIYNKWEKSGYFNPDNLKLSDKALSYTIILPPPNITDKLHLGHSVMIAIEDLLIRWHRQKGFKTLWLPGTDHAAIATQNVVEKKLYKEKGKTRHDLGKDEFLKEVWQFIDNTQATILNQIKKMGASLDWSRLAFTLDEKRQKAVKQMFIDMYQAGLIYRGERIVNWCPRCQSTLADDEVEYKETISKLYTFYYSPDLKIPISSTRPETKLGDSAIAVYPKDKRFTKYLKQTINIDFLGQNLQLKVIEDSLVDPEFAAGAFGVTPAHSLIDWQIAQKHDLAIKKVINEEAKIKAGYGKYSGLDVLRAREEIVADLKKKNLLIKEEEVNNNISVCYRCNSLIEPLLSKQWFVAVDKKIEKLNNQSLKESALSVVKEKKVKFIPQRFEATYLNWMNNLYDWCISRQIWFGHEIPAWYKGEEIYVGENPPKGGNWIKDEDSLDTWFSSGMWSFSTLGWPDSFIKNKKTGDLACFHPTQVLETGYEIISLWVSRMIMMSLFALNEIPFSQVYLHGMILDKNGKKMSKSKGNGIDPLDLIEKYGTDALRLSLLTGSTPGNDSRYSEEKIEAKRNFINKLWNISRFIIYSLKEKKIESNKITPKTLADHWILNQFFNLIYNTNRRLEKKEFSLAVDDLINFTWHDLADWYLEIAKQEKDKEEILAFILKNLLSLWHPFIPFVTEAIWQTWQDSLLIIERYPDSEIFIDLKDNLDKNNKDFKLIIDIITAIREARSTHKIEVSKKIDAFIIAGQKKDFLETNQLLIKNLKTNLKDLKIVEKAKPPTEAIFIIISDIEIYLSQAIDKKQEIIRLKKEQSSLLKLINNLKDKLNNDNFIKKAPVNIVNQEKDKLKKYQTKLEIIVDKLTKI